MRELKRCLLGAMLLATAVASVASEEHEGDSQAEEGTIVMTAEERAAQGIRTEPVTSRVIAETIVAPGEVRLNAYRTAQVTPRIRAQVVARRARLGDRVGRGDPLVTLSSVEMADAQGELFEADREWTRVRELGRGVVSEARFVAAEVARQRGYAAVRSFGMSDEQVADLLADGDATRATGEFDLLAPRAGTVISDPFVVGEVVEPGRVLFEISDESLLWVEAQLRPDQAARIAIGVPARVSRDGSRWLSGKVVRLHHRLNETTRTRGVRIEVPNPDHVLHAGDYVDVSLEVQGAEARTAVPAPAVLLMQGVPTVFKVEGTELHAQPVEPGVTRGGWTEIVAGLAEGDEVVVRGAFLLKSLALKSQMGEGHGH